MDVNKFEHNDWLRNIMLARGLKVPDIHEMIEDCYSKGTVNKWHSRAKPMPKRARELLAAKLNGGTRG